MKKPLSHKMEFRDVSHLAYSNLPEFFESRKIQRETPVISIDQFNINMRSMGYVIIEGMAAARERLPQRNSVVVIFSPTSEASRKKGNFVKLLDQMRMEGGAAKRLRAVEEKGENIQKQKSFPSNTDMIFISSEKPVSAISGYDEIMTSLKTDYENVYIEAYTYEKLIITPKNSIIPQHRIMSQEEVTKINNDRLTNNSRRAPIQASDLPIVWIGGRPGDVIEIRRPSGSTGYAINYRVVKG